MTTAPQTTQIALNAVTTFPENPNKAVSTSSDHLATTVQDQKPKREIPTWKFLILRDEFVRDMVCVKGCPFVPPLEVFRNVYVVGSQKTLLGVTQRWQSQLTPEDQQRILDCLNIQTATTPVWWSPLTVETDLGSSIFQLLYVGQHPDTIPVAEITHHSIDITTQPSPLNMLWGINVPKSEIDSRTRFWNNAVVPCDHCPFGK